LRTVKTDQHTSAARNDLTEKMSSRQLWFLCIISLFLVGQRFIPGLSRYALQLGLIGLAVSAVLAYRGMRNGENDPQYKSILALSIFSLVIVGVAILAVFLLLDGFKLRF
jgi:hypothetical protein